MVRHDIELTCTVTNIPKFIEIDLLKSNIGDSIHISQIELPEGVEPAIKDRDFTIATIAGRGGKQEKEDDAAEAAEGAEATAEGEEKPKAEAEKKDA